MSLDSLPAINERVVSTKSKKQQKMTFHFMDFHPNATAAHVFIAAIDAGIIIVADVLCCKLCAYVFVLAVRIVIEMTLNKNA